MSVLTACATVASPSTETPYTTGAMLLDTGLAWAPYAGSWLGSFAVQRHQSGAKSLFHDSIMSDLQRADCGYPELLVSEPAGPFPPEQLAARLLSLSAHVPSGPSSVNYADSCEYALSVFDAPVGAGR
jgi:hypothetical protein